MYMCTGISLLSVYTVLLGGVKKGTQLVQCWNHPTTPESYLKILNKKRKILTWTKFNTVTLFTVYSKLIYKCTCKRQVSVYVDLERGLGHPTPPLWKIQISEIYVIKLYRKQPPPPLENKDIPRPFPHPPWKNFLDPSIVCNKMCYKKLSGLDCKGFIHACTFNIMILQY